MIKRLVALLKTISPSDRYFEHLLCAVLCTYYVLDSRDIDVNKQQSCWPSPHPQQQLMLNVYSYHIIFPEIVNSALLYIEAYTHLCLL